MESLTDAQKDSICELYCRYVEPSWLNLVTLKSSDLITMTALGDRLAYFYAQQTSSSPVTTVRTGNCRVVLDPEMATKKFTSDTRLLCAEVYIEPPMVYKTYLEITQTGAKNYIELLQHILTETFKAAPGGEIFAICDNLVINLPYRYNPENPEPRMVTLAPSRSPGKENYRKVHKFVLIDVSPRFEKSICGSGKLKSNTHITLDCNKYTLDWFIDGIYRGILDLSKIKKRQRRNAYSLLDSTMVCTHQDIGGHMATYFKLNVVTATAVAPSFYESDDSDIDIDSDSD
jgi:hypothetical protein